MSRAIVLIVCLAAAGAVATYTHYSQKAGELTPVFTVHAPDHSTSPAAPIPRPVQPSQRPNPIPGDRASLVRELQRELKRVGCYSGDVNGVWTTSSRMAMKSVTDRVNATLPIDNPDDVLLSLVRGQQEGVCGAPRAVTARAPAEATSPDAKAEPQAEESRITTGSIVPATAAAATALAASAAIPKADPKGSLSENRARPAAVVPEETAPKTGQTERPTRQSSPVPSERIYERRNRRSASKSRPPKLIRDVLRAFGIR